MTFIPAPIYERLTSCSDKLPGHLSRFLLPGFSCTFIKGPWGDIISQWIITGEFVFWLHRIHIHIKCSLKPFTTEGLFTLHHLIKGELYCKVNDSAPVEWSDKLSHFSWVPGNILQEVFFDVGNYVSCHVDFKEPFLREHVGTCDEVLSLIESSRKDPLQFVQGPAVQHDHIVNHTWSQIPLELLRESSPVLYLESKVRDLLRMHCKGLSEKPQLYLAEHVPLRLEEIQAVQEVRRIIEEDITRHYSIKELSMMVNMNVVTLKRAFRIVFCTTILQHLINCRLEHGYRLILSSNAPIGNIANACGYVNASRFNVLFKRKYGMEPLKARRINGNK